MSYLEFFCNNIRNNKGDNECIKGSCNEMCPQAEKKLREKEKLVHVLEVVGSTRLLIKCYSRSAANSNMAIPSLLRPFHVLKETTQYLLLRVTERTDVTLACLYDFINDRLRAIRQDMTIQRLEPEECMQLLEPMIRFYLYFGYRLGASPLNEFDPVLNKKYLLECMKWFLSCCDMRDGKNDKTRDYELTELMSNCTIDKASKHRLTCDRILVESLYILCNLDNLHPLYRYLSLLPDIKSAPPLRVAYAIAIANLQGNYIKLCRLSEKLCPLTHCAFYLYLPTIQRRALQVMSHAYSSKQLSVPAEVIGRWLALDTDERAVSTCRHYGLKVNNAVHFAKTDFKTDVDLMKPDMTVPEKLNIPIQEIFTYRI